MATLTLVVLAAIFLLLHADFGSLRLPTLVFLSLPLSLVGGVAAVLLCGAVVSLGSLVGFVTVLGIGSRNALMFVSHCRHLEREEDMAFGPELVASAAETRGELLSADAGTPRCATHREPGHGMRPMLLLALLVLMPATLFGQEAVGERAEPKAPLPISVAEVTSEAERLAATLLKAKAVAEPAPRLAEISVGVEALEATVQSEAAALVVLLSGSPSSEVLGDRSRVWTGRQQEVSSWASFLSDRVGELDRLRQDLVSREERWKAALETAKSENAPAEATAAIRVALSSIADSQQAVTQRLGQLLGVQQRVSSLSADVEAQLVSIREARASFRASLLDRDAPYIWAMEGAPDGRPLRDRVGAAVDREVSAFRDYWSGPRAPTGKFIVVLIASLAGALILRRRGASDDASNLLAIRPVSAAFVAALALGPFIAGAVPRSVEQIMGFLFLIPALRVLTALMPARLHPALFVLGGFYVLDRVRGVLVDLPNLERALLAGELALALALLLWVLRPARISAADFRALPSPNTAWFLSRSAAIGLSAGLLAVCLGYLSLGRLLGEGTLDSIYLAVGAYGAYEVVSTVASRLIRVVLSPVSRVARQHRHMLELRFRTAAGWSAMAVWAFVALEFFSLQDAAIQSVSGALTAELSLGDVALSLGDVVLFLAAVGGAILVSRFVQFFLEEEVLPRFSLRRGVPHAIATMARYAALLIGFYLALAVGGFDLSRVTIIVGALGVGIGFGLQNVVNNFVSGLILLFERPVKVGDTIEIGSRTGEVKRIGIRSSTVRTFSGSEVIVPNSDLISNQVENWTLSDAIRRIEVPIGVAYGTPPQKVMEVLDRVAREHPHVLDDPKHAVFFQQFGNSSLDFELRVWVPTFDTWYMVRSELNVAISAALAEAGIEIPFPQRDLHLRSVSPAARRELGATAEEEGPDA